MKRPEVLDKAIPMQLDNVAANVPTGDGCGCKRCKRKAKRSRSA